MKISICSDHGGYNYKQALVEHLKENGHEIVDFGCYDTVSCDYPDYALPAAESVKDGKVQLGILICTTGIGMSIAANKVKGIRCAHCCDVETARLTRNHNDANMLAIGAMTVSVEQMYDIADTFISSVFDGGRHKRRVDKIMAIEAKYFK